ncbi:MAG: branched-chain amino acid transaminase [Vicinamibacterales bacterium]
MALPTSGKVWMNGRMVDWADATIHIGSHVIHYGSGVFEGIRCYKTPRGSVCFRLDAHIRRLYDSARIYRMSYEVPPEEFEAAALETVRANGFEACYIRPIVYRGYAALGVNPLPCPVDAAILVWEWGTYLGPEALERGVDVRVSSWWRSAPNTFPALAKASANYANSQLIRMEAAIEGYEEGIALDSGGHISEGSGENLFLVRDEVIYTPPLTASILPGITRDSVMRIASDMGYTVREEMLPREMLYVADEAFFAGTAVEITPIRSVDRITVGEGRRGPVTTALQRRYFDIINGETADKYGWLTYVYPEEEALRKPKVESGATGAGR